MLWSFGTHEKFTYRALCKLECLRILVWIRIAITMILKKVSQKGAGIKIEISSK